MVIAFPLYYEDIIKSPYYYQHLKERRVAKMQADWDVFAQKTLVILLTLRTALKWLLLALYYILAYATLYATIPVFYLVERLVNKAYTK